MTVDDDPAFGSPVVAVTGLPDTTCAATSLPAGTTLYWRVVARDAGGAGRMAVPQPSAFTIQALVGVPGEGPLAGASFAVRNPYPNPFRAQATLAFRLPHRADVSADVYDVTGRLIRSVARGSMDAGERSVTWDGHASDSRPAAAGLYFIRLAAGENVVTKRIVLAK